MSLESASAPGPASDWIAAGEAMARLGVKPQTLYAYVSRGLVASRGDGADPRRSLYAADDVQRLMQRKARGRRPADAARTALAAGEPVLESAITVLAHGAVHYRGRDAVRLAEGASLEEVARLLWDCGGFDPFSRLKPHPGGVVGADGRARAFALLAQRAAGDAASLGRGGEGLQIEAASLLTDLVDAVCGQSRNGALHQRLARAWRAEDRAEAIRAALVLCADHELNASTFAARVTASTGASLAAAALSGLATLSGPLHGGMTAQVAAFVNEARRSGDPEGAVAARLAQGLRIPGFGHPLHPGGDPRARALEAITPWPADLQAIRSAGEAVTGKAPNLDFALVATARALHLPADAPFTLFMVGRTAGWIAHALEQQQAGAMIRPRARYVGPAPGAA